jgi:hypothetical protein
MKVSQVVYPVMVFDYSCLSISYLPVCATLPTHLILIHLDILDILTISCEA